MLPRAVAQLVEHSIWRAECRGFKSHLIQLIFSLPRVLLNCVVLLCIFGKFLGVCLSLKCCQYFQVVLSQVVTLALCVSTCHMQCLHTDVCIPTSIISPSHLVTLSNVFNLVTSYTRITAYIIYMKITV